MFIFSYTAAVLSFICLGTAAFILLKKQTTIARYFAAYIFFIGVWVGSNSLADFSGSEFSLRLWSGMALFGGSFFVSFYMLFAEFFTSEHAVSFLKKLIFFLPSIIFSPLGFSNVYVTETFFPYGMPAQIIPGNINYLVLLFTVVGMTYGLLRPVFGLLEAPIIKKWQTAYISIGFLATMVGAIVFTIILPFLGELRFFSLGPQFAVITIAFTAYAIFRHQLLDIRIVIQRGIIYSLLLTLIIGFYLLMVFAIGVVAQQLTHFTAIISAAVTTVVGIIGVPPIEKYFRRITDKVFFKDRYDYSKAMHELSEILNQNVDLRKLTEEVSHKLKQIFKAESVMLDIFPRGKSTHAFASEGFDNLRELSLPVVLEEETIGAIAMGEKRSGDIYTGEDVAFLKTFSYQAAVALEKARLYEKAKKYSRELERKVKRRTAKISALQKEQEQMMLEISHGLQTPLTVIKGKLDFMKRKMPREKRLGVFERSIDEASRFIYDFLNLARLETTERDLRKNHIDLSKLLFEMVEYFEVLAKEKGIAIKSVIVPHIVILGDKNKIEELTTNLVSNAFKYLSPVREKKISIGLRVIRKKKVVLTIHDTGVGIRREDLPKVFTRFYRAGNNRGKNIQGSGLGLAIAKKIVEKHNGTISVRSVFGKETTFTVTFPLYRTKKQSITE